MASMMSVVPTTAVFNGARVSARRTVAPCAAPRLRSRRSAPASSWPRVRSRVSGRFPSRRPPRSPRAAARRAASVVPRAGGGGPVEADTVAEDVRFDMTEGGQKKRWSMIFALFVAFVLCNLDKVNMSVAIVPMSASFGWTSVEKGLVQSAFFWGYAFTQIPGGWLAQKYGGKLVLFARVMLEVLAHAHRARLRAVPLHRAARVALPGGPRRGRRALCRHRRARQRRARLAALQGGHRHLRRPRRRLALRAHHRAPDHPLPRRLGGGVLPLRRPRLPVGRVVVRVLHERLVHGQARDARGEGEARG